MNSAEISIYRARLTDELGRFFYATLFLRAPETRELFPVNMEVQRSRLLRALVHVVQMVDQPDDLVPFLDYLAFVGSAVRSMTRSAIRS